MAWCVISTYLVALAWPRMLQPPAAGHRYKWVVEGVVLHRFCVFLVQVVGDTLSFLYCLISKRRRAKCERILDCKCFPREVVRYPCDSTGRLPGWALLAQKARICWRDGKDVQIAGLSSIILNTLNSLFVLAYILAVCIVVGQLGIPLITWTALLVTWLNRVHTSIILLFPDVGRLGRA